MMSFNIIVFFKNNNKILMMSFNISWNFAIKEVFKYSFHTVHTVCDLLSSQIRVI